MTLGTETGRTIRFHLTGERAMLQHNGRMANPIDPWTRRLSALTSKRQKTDDDLGQIMLTEARGACWETDDGLIGVPNAAVWRCIYDAAKAYKRGEDVKRALSFEDVTVAAFIGGETITADAFVRDPANIDYRPVKINGRKTMRARPRLREWASEHEFGLLTDVMDVRDLVQIVERAGRLVGIGDWRPIYGVFTASIE